MARPIKNNADYHSHDSNMRNDIKIKALRRKYNITGYAIYNMMLEVLTDSEFFEYEWNDFNIEMLSGDFEIEPELLKEIINYCVNSISLFVIENGKIWSYRHKERFNGLLSKRKNQRNGVIDSDNTQSKEKKSKVEKIKIKEIDEFLEFRKSELNQYSDEIKAKLKKYKITEPICFIGKGIPVQYYDLVEILVNVIFDLEWQKDLVNRFGLLRFENSLIDFYLTLKASSEYQNYKGENDFKRHYTNWLNKNVEKYRK